MEINLKTLNDEQKKAVIHGEGPLLIVAGAGTGKTTVITQRIGWLLEQEKAKPDEILALTFTEKAAAEMEERVDRLLPYGYIDLWVMTFHAFCEKVLQRHALEVGIPSDFKILDQTQQWMLVRQNLDRFTLDYYKPLGNPTRFIHALVKLFSKAKDEVIRPEDFLRYTEELKLNSDSSDFIKGVLDPEALQMLSAKEKKELRTQEIKKIHEVANAYHTYQQLLLENGSLDFGDLLNYSLELFKKRPKVLARYRSKFKYLLVDEFQDTNYAQYELVKLLAEPRRNLTVVGDDDQCLPSRCLIKTKTGSRKIQDIRLGDEVATAVGRGYFSYAPVSKVFRNEKKVKFINFKTAQGYSLKVTDNHKMFCLTPAVSDQHYSYVYLMHRKNLGWRIGVTNDLSARLRLERSADRILGIKACLSEAQAKFYETLYSLKYNIPTVVFKARKDTTIKDQWLLKLYRQIDTEKNVQHLAADLNLDLKTHHYCLAAVNRGSQTRIKINLEMCFRRYRSKFARHHCLINPKVFHLLSLETSDNQTIKKLKQAGFRLTPAKRGYRFRLTSTDLQQLGATALKLEKITGGIMEVSAKLGRQNIQTRKALVVPAKNILVGQYVPILTKQGIVYDRIIKKVEEKEKTVTVYDLEVARSHNFIANGIVIHNSIYKFRGASLANILEFKQDYPTATEIFLTKNYRSTQGILNLSYQFIQQNNPNRLEVKLTEDKEPGTRNREQGTGKRAGKLSKKLISQTKDTGDIKHNHFATLDDEIRGVLTDIARVKEAHPELGWNEFAILARTNDVVNLFAIVLSKTQIPYRFVASKGLYTKPIILDVVAYLRLLDDYHESPAVHRVLASVMVGLGHKDIVKFNYWARRKGYSLFAALQHPGALKEHRPDVQEQVQRFLQLVNKHTALAKDKSASEVLLTVLDDTGYTKQLAQAANLQEVQNAFYLNQFYRRVADFEATTDEPSVKKLLELLNLELEAGETGALLQDIDQGPDAVRVMTAHAAKGLEFSYVWIVGLVDRRFPTDDRPDLITIPDALIKEVLPEGDIHLEEERRLFYVAMTRAKKGLYFTSATDYGGMRKKKISRFLSELGSLGLALDITLRATAAPVAAGQKSDKATGSGASDFSYLIPKRFSFSQLNAFDHCPYHYWLEYLLRIPQKGKNIFSFGSTIHQTLQQFFILVRERTAVAQADLFGGEADTSKPHTPMVSLQELLELYDKAWIDDWYTTRQEHDDYRARGKQMLQDFYQAYEQELPVPKLLETPFSIHLDDPDTNQHYSVVGKIDRIDQFNGGVEIIDYKTGDPKSAERLSAEDKRQLLLYQLAAQEHLGQTVTQLTYYYLKNGGHKTSFIGTEKDLVNLKAWISKTIQKIHQTSFPLTPADCTCRQKDLRTV